jgi:signal transduction histidine kinase
MKKNDNNGKKPEIDLTIKITLTVLVGVLLFIDVLRFFNADEIGWRLLLFIVFLVFGADYLKQLRKGNSGKNIAADKSAASEREKNEQKHLEDAKTQFILSTQHHLRGPLTVIQGYLSLVLDGAYGRINEKARTKIKASLDETQKMIKIVNEFLDVVKYQMDNNVLQKNEIDISGMIKEITTDLLAYARARDLYLDLEEVGMPAPKVLGDCSSLKEAFYNIIDNAIKYTEDGGVKVKIAGARDYLEIAVIDTGIGLEEAEKKDIFLKTFRRGERAWKTNTHGKGIGLYLAAQTIVGHGGSIRVESDGPNKGSIFYIRLPISEKSE